jgi:NADH dehydrogenase
MKNKDYPDGLPGLAQVAIQQGNFLAKNLKRLQQNLPPRTFRYTNKGVLATIGRNKAVADLPNNFYLHGFIAWAVWMIVHLMFLVGFRNKVVAMINWVWNYFTYDRGIRLIIRPSGKPGDAIIESKEEQINETN